MVSLETLLGQLADLGIVFWVAGNRLKYAAPFGALTPDRMVALKERREELVARISGPLVSVPVGIRILHREASCVSRLWWQHNGGEFACLKCHPPTHRCTVQATNYAGVVPVADWRIPTTTSKAT